MKQTKFLILSLLFASVAIVSGQSQSTDKEVNEDLKSLNSENAELNLINSQILQVNQQQVFEFTGNNVNITQVGQGNFSRVVTFSENSNLVLRQSGNRNTSILDLRASTIDYSLIQTGANNFIVEYSRAPKMDLTRNLSQNGDRNSLVVHGANSITKDLKLNIQGNAKTVIIRNFN